MAFALLLLLAQAICLAQGRKNVLLVIADDLRPALGCYGDPNALTPNFDALAKKGTVFTKAYAQQALCAPSRNSFLTSRHPDSLFNYDLNSYWRATAGNFTTLPQHFKEHGYTTALFSKIFHPGTASNRSDDGPYSWSIPPFQPSTNKFQFRKVCPQADGKRGMNLLCPVEPELQPGGTLPDMQTTQAVKHFLRNHNHSSSPFFLGVGFHKPHIMLRFPRKYLDFHPLDKVSRPVPAARSPTQPLVSWNPWTDIRWREDVAALNISFPFGPVPDDFTQKIRQHYYAAVTYVDDLFGELMQVLEEQNLMENTIIAMLGDHGWSLGEHGEWAKYSNYENALRVPLIIYDPDKQNQIDKAPSVREELVELVDLFPTLAELASVAPPPRCSPPPTSQDLCTEGRSLAKLMSRGESSPAEWRRGAFSQTPRPGVQPEDISDKPQLKDIRVMGYTVRTQRHRYTEWVAFRELTPHWDQLEGVELYDHHIDPAEEINLAGREGLEDVQKQLSVLLRGGWSAS